MAKNRNLKVNTFYNFKLRKRPSFFIGTYIILSSFFIKYTLSEFITDSSPFGFLTVNYLEDFIFIISIFTVLLSLLSLFIFNRKHSRKIGYKVWNLNSKKMMWFLFLIILLLYISLFSLLRFGLENFIIPAFIMKDNKPFMSFGLMGGAMQPQGHAQIIINMIDFACSHLPGYSLISLAYIL